MRTRSGKRHPARSLTTWSGIEYLCRILRHTWSLYEIQLAMYLAYCLLNDSLGLNTPQHAPNRASRHALVGNTVHYRRLGHLAASSLALVWWVKYRISKTDCHDPAWIQSALTIHWQLFGWGHSSQGKVVHYKAGHSHVLIALHMEHRCTFCTVSRIVSEAIV